MTSSSRIAALPAAAMTTFALAGCGGDKATPATFTGTWQGHGRTLNITRTGNAEERSSNHKKVIGRRARNAEVGVRVTSRECKNGKASLCPRCLKLIQK